jgi:hypothetical protein
VNRRPVQFLNDEALKQPAVPHAAVPPVVRQVIDERARLVTSFAAGVPLQIVGGAVAAALLTIVTVHRAAFVDERRVVGGDDGGRVRTFTLQAGSGGGLRVEVKWKACR